MGIGSAIITAEGIKVLARRKADKHHQDGRNPGVEGPGQADMERRGEGQI